MSNSRWKIWEHPLTGASFTHVIGMLWRNGFGWQPIYLLRISFVLLTTSLLMPFRLLERILFDRKIREHALKEDPIFIVGHWRSGTTYLHNMFSQDENFGYMNTFDAFVPDAFIVGKYVIKPFSQLILPSKRPMDAVRIHPNFPQEEEFALASQTSLSFYECLYFPERVVDTFAKYIFFETISENEKARWRRAYKLLVKKISFAKNGKQLVLKNPINTGRIPALLELFPNAKFVYISRDSKAVLTSTISMNKKLLALYSLKNYEEKYVEQFAVAVHERMIEKYEQDKLNIPSGNLIEIKYADFVSNPVEQMERIYRQFNLNGFEKASIKFQNYFDEQKNYQPNKFSN